MIILILSVTATLFCLLSLVSIGAIISCVEVDDAAGTALGFLALIASVAFSTGQIFLLMVL